LSDIYRVNSIPAAAYVIAHGVSAYQLVLVAPGRVEFLFEDASGKKVETLVSRYFAGDSCCARTFYRALQDVRLAVNKTLSGGAR